MKTAILGTGAYGFALAKIIINNCNNIAMWTPYSDEIAKIKEQGKIDKLKQENSNLNVDITDSIDLALRNSDLVIIAVPVVALDELFQKLKHLINDGIHICIASKGVDGNSLLFAHEILERYINTSQYAILSGPSFAIDLENGALCGLNVATKNKETAQVILKILNTDMVKLKVIDDVIGIELCGAVKNIMAIGSGILDGMGATETTKALFLTEALNSLNDIILKYNGRSDTILSYAGFGDFILTCNSDKSRNFQYGQMIGKGLSSSQLCMFLENNTVEGYGTLSALHNIFKNNNVNNNLINVMYDVVAYKDNPQLVVEFLKQNY